MLMIALGVVLFLLMTLSYGVERKITSVHLTKLQNTSQNTQNRALKNLAYRQKQSLFVLTILFFIFGFSWVYIVATQLHYLLAICVVATGLLATTLLTVKTKLFNPLLFAIMKPLDKFIRRYDRKLGRLSNYFMAESGDQKIYKPYDDKEFKKLITGLHSSDNLVNKKVLSKIENLFKLQYSSVEDIMIPMSKVVVIDEDDYIGPILLDELHKTSLTIFPVASQGRIIGSVRLIDMKDHTAKTKVKDFTKSEVNYIKEDESIEGLIEVFAEYKNEQFLVIDGKENIKGVVNIYQVLQLFFDQNSEKV